MRVLVMGGNRYIGLHLVFELARQGHDVTVMNSHPAPLPEGARRLHGDRTKPGMIEQMLGPVKSEFDAVFDNTAYRPSDLLPLLGLFRGRVKHYVFTSSIAVYLPSDAQPINEQMAVSADKDTTLFPGYGDEKVLCERLLRQEFELNCVPTTALRIAHTCGPFTPLPREMSQFARLEMGRPILVPGEGSAYVHVVHVQDVARALCAVLGKDCAAGQIYNVAGPQVSSILGYMRLMARAVGVPVNIVHVPAELAKSLSKPIVHWGEWRTGGMVFSIDKIRRDLGWEPQFGLEDAFADSYRWFKTEGRQRYTQDFSHDDAVLATMTGASSI